MPPEIQTEIQAELQPEIENYIQAEITPEEPKYDAKTLRLMEVERKKLELRRRMEEASKARKSKKGFMTPDRKKKLRLLLRKKAAEELKKEQERKAEERRWIIEDRCGEPEDLEWASKDDLKDICDYYFQRILECESDKWDLETQIRRKAFEIADLNTKVNDLRGKFQKPILKKVSKYENKFAKLQRKAAEFNFRNQLKMVRRHDFTIKDGDDKKSQADKQEREETTESVADEGEEKVPEEGAEVETSAPEEGDGEKNPAVEGEEPSEGVVLTEGESRLEGEVPPTFEGEAGEKGVEVEGEQPLGAEGELRLADQKGLAVEGEPLPEGQSPAEEEVQAAEPPPPPEPEHTEEDLWEYLRDTVSSVHPATVEEFLENLIGTLQQVPQEYLKPVIEANVKRATSPSVTDGDHLPLSEDVPLEGEAAVSTGEVPPTEETDSASPPEVALAAEGEALLEESAAPTEVSSELAEDSTAPENTEGYPALEATA